MKDKKGIAIILDAFIALLFVLTIFTIYYGMTHSKVARTSTTEFKKLHYSSEDILDVLNKEGALDVIGEEWAYANQSTNSTHWQNASSMMQAYLEKLLPENLGYEVTIDEAPLCDSDEINDSGRPSRQDATSETHSTRLLVGYGAGLPTRGQVARAFLKKIREKTTSAYEYFGGFVGQGNLTVKVRLPSTLDTVQQAYVEMAAGGPFNLYVNGYDYGAFLPAGDALSANVQQFLASPSSHFVPGENTIEFKFTGDLSEQYVGGGFVKVTYNTSEMETATSTGTEYYYFPGIDGMINYYSSLYVPGTMTSMQMYLKFMSNYTTYMTLGNTQVFSVPGKNSTQEIYLNDANFTPLDYNDLSLETIPLRLGITGVSTIVNATGNADVILITDVSGSMSLRLNSDSTGTTRTCTDPNLYSSTTSRISLAKCLDRDFVDVILNTTGNRVGLVSFSTSTSYESLTTNGVYLKTKINQYSANGGTCICCAINRAYDILQSGSNSSRQKFIIVMSDGVAGYSCGSCGNRPTCSGTCTQTSGTYDCGGGSSDCTGAQCNYAINDAICSSQRVHNPSTINATVHSIGFGPVISCSNGNLTLHEIANYGGGTYYRSDNATALKEIYQGIAEQIVNMSYSAQTATVTGTLLKSILYPESYIKVTYAPQNLSVYGEITLTQNTDRFNNTENCTGEIYVTQGATVVDAKITSFSAEHWSDLLIINGQVVYSLRDGRFGYDYSILGDPFVVQVPNPSERILSGATNLGEMRIGSSESEDMKCSGDNRAIFTQRIDARVGYGDVFPKKDGCKWNIQFEDNSYLDAKIPSDYNGTNECSYTQTNKTYDSQDAIDDAIIRLIQKLDSNNNGKIDIKFDSDMVEFDFSRAGGVRSLWGPITLKLVLWS